MGDPFSVAGTAVGITSLGIQVCQGLVQYYTQFRSYHDDIESAIQRLEGLQGILEALESVKGKVELDNHKPSEQLQLAMRACEAAVKQLDIQVKKCGDMKLPETFKDRTNMVMKRLYWPFKKETLKDLQATLDRLQTNLQLCLQILNLDISHQKLETLSTIGQELILRSDNLEAQQADHSRALDRIETGIEDVISSSDEQTSVLTTQMAYHSANMALQLETIQKSLSLLMTDEGKVRRAEELPLSVLSDTMKNHQNASARFSRSLRRYSKSYSRLRKHQSVPTSPCNCRQYKQEKRWYSYRAWGNYSSTYEIESEHVPECRHFRHTDCSSVMQAQFIHCSRYLGFCVNIELSYLKLQGTTTFSPMISYKAIVCDDSPGFKPFQIAEAILDIQSFDSVVKDKKYWTHERVGDLCDTTLKKVIQSFQDGTAKPSDTRADGQTILHSASRFIGKLVSEHVINEDTVSMVIGSLIAAGVPTNEKLFDDGSTPLDVALIIARSVSDASKALFRLLIESLDSWSIHVDPTGWGPETGIHTNISNILTVGDYATGYDASSAELAPAFIQRSIPVLQGHIESDAWNVRKPPPWTLLNWNEGLDAYPLGSVNWSYDNRDGYGILGMAIFWKNAWAINHLVRNGAPLRPYYIGYLRHRFRNAELGVRLELESLFAQTLKRQELRLSSGDEHWDLSYGDFEDCSSLYFDRLDCNGASVLYDAGFREIDTPLTFGDGIATPAWVQSILMSNSIAELSKLLQWFQGKGANLEWIHRDFGTTSIHMFARRLADAAVRSTQSTRYILNDEGTEGSFWPRSILSETRDQCSCHCSTDGCLPVTAVMQEALDTRWQSLWDHNDWKSEFQSKEKLEKRANSLISRICSKMDVLASSPKSHYHAVIRALTFELLHLSHTCCRYIARELSGWWDEHDNYHAPIKRPSFDEIQEIHDIESKQINLLEKFMAHFEPKWDEYSGSFYDFIETVWKPYIEEELEKYYGDNEEEARRFEAVGVMLKDEDSEDENGEDNDGTDTVVYGPERPPEHDE